MGEVTNKVKSYELTKIRDEEKINLLKIHENKYTCAEYTSDGKLADMLTYNTNILMYGKEKHDNNHLIYKIVNILKLTTPHLNRKINIKEIHNDYLNEFSGTVNIIKDINDSFFVHDKYTTGSIASTQSSNELNAIIDFALEIKKPLQYVLSNFDFIVRVGTSSNPNIIIKTESLETIIAKSSICCSSQMGKYY